MSKLTLFNKAKFLFQVMSNIVDPIVDSCLDEEGKREKSASQERFMEAFKRVVERVAQHLNEQPVIVAHSENTFDGSGIRRLLSNKFEFDKVSSHTYTHMRSKKKLVKSRNDDNESQITVRFGCRHWTLRWRQFQKTATVRYLKSISELCSTLLHHLRLYHQ